MFIFDNPIDNQSVLLQTMACGLFGDKLLPEFNVTQFTNVYVRPLYASILNTNYCRILECINHCQYEIPVQIIDNIQDQPMTLKTFTQSYYKKCFNNTIRWGECE